MLYRIFFLLGILFSQILSAQSLTGNMVARWGMNSDSEYILLSEKIISAIDQKKLVVYDSSWKPVSSKDIFFWINQALKSSNYKEITLEECSIALSCGDMSVLHSVKSTFSLDQLTKMAETYSSSNQKKILKTLSYRKTSREYNCLGIEVIELINLDTTKREQRGQFQYFKFSIDSIHNFYVKYEDFIKLNYEKEIQAVQSHLFHVTNSYGSLVIQFANQELNFKSQFASDQEIDIQKLNKTLFLYFKNQLRLYKKMGNVLSGDFLITNFENFL